MAALQEAGRAWSRVPRVRPQSDGSIDPALDSDAFARFGLTLAMGALVMRTLEVDAPPEGAWHELISRLLDAVSEEHTDDD